MAATGALGLALVAMLADRPWGDDAATPAPGQGQPAHWRPGPLRTLRVVLLGAGDRVWAQAMELAPALLRSARPVTNSVAGRAHAARPDCVDGATDRPSVTFHQHDGSRAVQIVWRFSTSSHLVPCHFRRVLELSVLDGGRPAAVRGPAHPLGAAGLCRPVQALEARDRGMGSVGGASHAAGRIVG